MTNMYSVAVKRDFVAQHFLIGGDWGAENDLHSHHYTVELRILGSELDQHGYLVDIVDIEAQLDDLVRYFRDHTLNDLPEFEGLNPSIEHFSKIICHQLAEKITGEHLNTLEIKIWENEIAWAGFQMEL